MSSGNFFSPAGLSAAATILLTLPGQVQASAENYQYQMKYSADAQSIRPTTVFDDGKATWFVIPSDPKIAACDTDRDTGWKRETSSPLCNGPECR